MLNRRFRRKIRMSVQFAADNRPKIIKVSLICTACLVIVIILSVALGNHLRNRVDDAQDSLSSPVDTNTPASPTDDEVVAIPTPFDPVTVPTINGKYITLSSSAGIDWSARISSLQKESTTAVSLILYYGDSIVNYSSPTAQAMGLQSEQNSKTQLYGVMGMLRNAGIYTAGCFYPTFHNQTDRAIGNIYREYEAALIAEALESGLLEVTVFGMGCDQNAHKPTDQLFTAVRTLYPSAVLGVALPYEIIGSADRQLIIDNFSYVADYLALDLSTCLTADELTRALTDAAPLIKKYNLRIIVSNKLDEATQILADAECINWQNIPD